MLHKLGGDVSSGIRYRCGETSLLTNLVEGRKERVGADEQVLIVLRAALQAVDQNGGGEAGVLQNAAANERGNFAWGRGVREILAGNTTRLRQLALLTPAAEAIEFVASDFDVEVMHGDEVGKRGDFILSGQDDIGRADGIRETEFFEFGEALGKKKSLFSVNARIGDGFVERNLGGPLRDGIVALAALVEADVDGVYFVEEIGGAFDEEIGEAGSSAGVNESGAMLGFEFSCVAVLFGAERIASEMGTEVEIARAEAKGRADDDFVEDGSGSIDDELAALGGADDSIKIAGVHFSDGDGGFLAEEAAGALRVAVATPDVVALPFKKLCEKGASGAGSEDEDSHARK